MRHEQGAGHMAEGFAHATGRPGVAMVTSGPGATNIVTPLVRRLHGLGPDGRHHRPGARPRSIGTDAFQECDITGITRGVTKHNELVTRAEDIPLAIRQAFHIATTGRPGPGARRHPQGHRRPDQPQLGDGLELADRRRGGVQPAGLQAARPRVIPARSRRRPR
ncbi:MAG: thiamine pyrophosphate-binding protein [Microthrixaceae bacterium]